MYIVHCVKLVAKLLYYGLFQNSVPLQQRSIGRFSIPGNKSIVLFLFLRKKNILFNLRICEIIIQVHEERTFFSHMSIKTQGEGGGGGGG